MTEPEDTEMVGRAIQAAALQVQAPAALRERLADAALRADGGRRRRRRWAWLPAAGVAALAVALVVLVTGGDSGAPSLQDATALALARPVLPAPATDAGDARLVRATVGDIRFPNYSYRWPQWKTSGARRDTISGRDAVTVTYRGPSGDVGYTIVDGAPLSVPDGTRRVEAGGVRFALQQRGDATVLTWVRDGHTCILAGRGAKAEQLVAFATWT